MLTNSGSQGNANFTWIPNFGASFHVTGEPQNIKQFSHFDESNQIFIGNSEGLSIFVVVSSSFVPPNDSKITFKLHNLLHVPSITKNLLSVSQFVKDNLVFFEFHPYMCLVKSQGTNRVHLQGVVSVDGLYSFHNLKLQDHLSMLLSSSDPFVGSAIVSSLSSAVDTVANKASNVVSNFVLLLSTNVNLWHARLGHPNSHVMKLVFNHCKISSSNKIDLDFCASCCMGKSHMFPSHSSISVYSHLLQTL